MEQIQALGKKLGDNRQDLDELEAEFERLEAIIEEPRARRKNLLNPGGWSEELPPRQKYQRNPEAKARRAWIYEELDEISFTFGKMIDHVDHQLLPAIHRMQAERKRLVEAIAKLETKPQPEPPKQGELF